MAGAVFVLHLSIVWLTTSGFSGLGAERTWDGSGRSDSWSESANWAGFGVVPVPGDSLRFPAGVTHTANENDFAAGTVFGMLTFAGPGYTTSGNEVGLTDGITVSHGAGNTVLNLPIALEGNQTFLVSQAGANLFLNRSIDLGRFRVALTFDGAGQSVVAGNIHGGGLSIDTGAIRKNGSGTLLVLQHLTFGGDTIVNGGTLRVDHSMSNSAVTLNATATLRGSGKVGGVTANAGATVAPGSSAPNRLVSLGSVVLNAGSTFTVRLNGTTAGSGYDQLEAHGTVTLGGTLNVSAGFVASVGDRFTIIDNDGNDDVVGTFAGLPEGAIFMLNGRPFQITYGRRGLGGFGRDVNDVELEAMPGLSIWDGGGQLNNFWSQPLNWVGDVLPMPGDDLLFPTSGTTSNDFTSGRRFGKLMLSGGNHTIQGVNLAEFEGGLEITQAGKVNILMPLGLAGGFRLTQQIELTLHDVHMRASQTFWLEQSHSLLFLDGLVDMGSHNLIIRNDSTFSIGNTANSQVTVHGSLTGTGIVTKEGPGYMALQGNIASGGTVVNGGNLRVLAWPQEYHGLVQNPVTVNAGARLTVEGDVLGDTLINAGGVLAGFFGGMVNVDVRGGTLAPSGLSISGNLRMSDGAIFSAQYDLPSVSGNVNLIEVSVEGEVELIDATLQVSLQPGVDITPGARSILMSLREPAVGFFRDLPEGHRFALGGHVFTIHYGSGLYGISLFADEPFVWSGAGSGNLWTTASNWVGNFAPITGMDLVFPGGVSKLATLPDFPTGTPFRSLVFSGPSYVVAGNDFSPLVGLSNLLSSGLTTINANIVANGTLACEVGGSSRLTLEGIVYGNGSWTKSGPGTVRLSGDRANTGGGWTVLDGDLELAKVAGQNAVSNRLDVGAGPNAAAVIWLQDHQVADSISVSVGDLGELSLNGNNETIGSLRGSGQITLLNRLLPARPSQLTVQSGDFSGRISGNDGITKIGSGQLRLSGENDYTGNTIVGEGTLLVDGMQSNSPVRLAGGVLRGRGWVGTITSQSGGVVFPGRGLAEFQVALHSQSVELNPAARLRVFLASASPGFENSQLEVNGTVNLGGCALELEPAFVPPAGMTFIIVDNDKAEPVVGTFAGLPEGATFDRAGLRCRVTYTGGTGNDVAITVVQILPPIITSFTATKQPNQRIEVHLMADGIPGATYGVEASTNFMGWTLLFNVNANATGVVSYLSNGPDIHAQRFYRLRLQQ